MGLVSNNRPSLLISLNILFLLNKIIHLYEVYISLLRYDKIHVMLTFKQLLRFFIQPYYKKNENKIRKRRRCQQDHTKEQGRQNNSEQ